MIGRFYTIVAVLLACLSAVIFWERKNSETNPNASELAEWASGRTFLVTGANAGLGYHTVQHLVQTGTAHAVIMACRNERKCQDAKESIQLSASNISSSFQQQLLTVSLDLSSLDSIRQCSAQIKGLNYTTPLTLILNAGIMGETSDNTYSNETGVEHHMQVNHLGHFYLTHLLFPLLERVVVVSSLVCLLPFRTLHHVEAPKDPTRRRHSNTIVQMFRSWRGYGQSKRANLLFASELHRRCYSTTTNRSLTVVAAHPGYSRTKIMLTGFKWAPPWIRQFLHTNKIGSMSPEYGSLSQVQAALDPQFVAAPCHETSASYYVAPRYLLVGDPVVVGTPDLSWHHWPLSRNESSALWDWSLRKLNIHEFGSTSS